MKTATLTAASIVMLSPVVQADFSIWAVGIGAAGIGFSTEGWQVYDNDSGSIDCSDALDWVWRDSDDVSGWKYGVRCQGDSGACTRSSDGSGIERLELNTRQFGDGPHFTYYRDRDGGMYNRDDVRVGTCTPDDGEEFWCGLNVGRSEGTRKLNCESGITAEMINERRPQ